MTEKYNQTIVILAFCSAFTDFLISIPKDTFYPRDRIIHIIISALIFMVVAHIINIIRFERAVLKFIVIFGLIIRLIYLVYNFSIYFRMFYGNNNIGIIVFTATVFIMAFKLNDKNFGQIGGFYIIVNIIIFIFFILSVSKINAANIYSLNTEFRFSFTKLFVLFDIFTISIISANKISKCQNQNNYILLSATIFIIITLIQGFTIKGNLLYSLTPLQSVLQILSGNTVKRYDYIFNLVFIFNYFGAVILYAMSIRKLLDPEMYVEED